MNSGPTINLLRVLFVAFAAYLGNEVGAAFAETHWARFTGVLGGMAFGLFVVLADRLLKGFSLRLFSSATFGLLLGFLASRLLMSSGLFERTPPDALWLIRVSVYATLSYIGMMLAMRSHRDEFALVIPYIRFREERQSSQEAPVLVDSNIIIDGRLREVVATGFLSGSFVVPRFILEELQTLADSNDPIKRDKGRSALLRLGEMQKSTDLTITVTESALDPFAAVDSKLVQLAKMMNARLLTNDGNLCSIARMQGVIALNLNDLARAMRPALTAGDDVEVPLSKEGRDIHQAVGYLSDGTMIVVNHARAHIGKTVRVSISSVLQTSAGRLFFAELKAAA
jgi:uncharacterized protein YacL